MPALQGVVVVVTRPERQATPLCQLLESQGARAIRLPVIEISAVNGQPQLAALLNPRTPFDLVIFTSANAVEFAVPWLDRRSERPIAAIGPATARALRRAGLRVTVVPAAGFDSENLLLRPELQNVASRRLLLVKGVGGRNLLEERLVQRGAHVVTAEVYRRERVLHSAQDLDALGAGLASSSSVMITATSVEIAAGLLESATPALRRELDRMHWVVPGARVAAAVRGLGVSAPIVQAQSAEDHDLLTAMTRWRSSVSGA